MKAAFATWQGRIAPLFDVCRTVRLVESAGGSILRQSDEILPGDDPVRRLLGLAELGAGELICGAVSRPLLEMAAGYGIRMIPFVAGELDKVIEAWSKGGLLKDDFCMPGCRRARMRRLGKPARGNKEGRNMNGGKGGSGGGGRGRGGGGGGNGMGRGGGVTPGPGGSCVCPNCGREEPHQRGVPCFERKCPDCGAAMTRKQ